ncbi:hypothetical protein FGB62_22g845 [Gracilaria domingensis]|nr:hypothetical protein FGB62_22g845 [Gracilaria domingensis]
MYARSSYGAKGTTALQQYAPRSQAYGIERKEDDGEEGRRMRTVVREMFSISNGQAPALGQLWQLTKPEWVRCIEWVA